MSQNPLQELGAAARQREDVINTLATKRYQLGDGLALSVLEALEVWVRMADNPQNSSHLVARDQLRRLTNVLEEARAITSGIHLAKQIPGDGNGRT